MATSANPTVCEARPAFGRDMLENND